jgi:HAD superfamily hydrolase (TIGR01456 family)
MRRAPAHIRPRTLGSRSSWGQQLHRRRFLGSSSSPSSAAVCFDIDGVLLKGKVLLPGARESLRRLHDSKVPFIFVTNGGGCTEAEKAAELSRKFDLEIPRSMVLLSHSPMRKLAERYKSKRVLVLGNRCQEIAQEDLGLHNTVTVPEIAGTWPGMYHFGGSTFYTQKIFPAPGDGMSSSPVEAIMVVHDPLDWHVSNPAVSFHS